MYNRKMQKQLASSTSRSRYFTLLNKASCMATKCFQRPEQTSSHKSPRDAARVSFEQTPNHNFPNTDCIKGIKGPATKRHKVFPLNGSLSPLPISRAHRYIYILLIRVKGRYLPQIPATYPAHSALFLEPTQPVYEGEKYYMFIHTVQQHPPCSVSLYMG